MVAKSKKHTLKNIPVRLCKILKRNPQYLTEKQMNALIASIKRDGFLAPILVRPMRSGTYEILSGNHRFMAAKEIGYKTLPAVVANLTLKQAQRIAVNLNTVHGEPTAELMAPFLADIDDDVLRTIHFDNAFLKELAEFDEILKERLDELELPESFDNDAPKTKNPKYKGKCPECGRPF